jgi:hypothetical protein
MKKDSKTDIRKVQVTMPITENAAIRDVSKTSAINFYFVPLPEFDEEQPKNPGKNG